MLVRALIGVFVLFFATIIMIASLPAIATSSRAVRTDPAQDVGLMCSTGIGETSCTITLTAENAWPDTTGMTVTETSPGSVDRTASATVQSDRTMISVSGLTASTAYVFTVDYDVVAANVSAGLNSVLVPLPFIVGLGALVAVVAAVILGFVVYTRTR